MKQIGLKSYQDIKLPKEWDEPSIDDFWEMFLSKYDPKGELSDDDAETVRHWWYEFKGGTGCEWDDGLDTTLEEMKEQLKDLYERRGVHTCETCEQCVNGICQDIWKSQCRTGNNDDYTMYDHWKKRMTIEDWKKEAEEQRLKANVWMSRSCDYGNEIYYIKENLLDASQKEKLAEWEKEQKNDRI